MNRNWQNYRRLMDSQDRRNHKPTDSTTNFGFNVSAFSVEHPWSVIAFYSAILILALITVFGGIMPRRMMPYVESPLVGIVTTMPGLSAQEMEIYVSKPIEERMTDIRGARYIRSTSQDGLSVVSLEFPYGTNMQNEWNNLVTRSWDEIQEKVCESGH